MAIQQTRKAGDWDCKHCGSMNFSRRIKCFKCSQPQPEPEEKTKEWYWNKYGSNVVPCDQLEICRKILKQNLDLNAKFIEHRKDKCFCKQCREERHKITSDGKGSVCNRGGGTYIIPDGWTRICLWIDKKHCDEKGVFKTWHPAYHGTTKESVEKIINGGCKFLRPGQLLPDGSIHGIRKDTGRIRSNFTRINKYTGKEELFDPNQVFTSPSIRYSAADNYSRWFECNHPNKANQKLRVKFVFAIRQKADSFDIGQETIGAGNKEISPYIGNDRIEYYTKHNDNNHFAVMGLLMKYEEI